MNIYFKSALVGMIAGMRSMSAPAFVSRKLSREQSAEINNSAFKFLSSTQTANILKVLAAGEMFADKLPMIPARILPAPLAARAVSGAVCGAALCKSKGERSDEGAFIGALTAVFSAYGFYYLRRDLGKVSRVPDALLGAVEDALVIEIGLKAIDEKN